MKHKVSEIEGALLDAAVAKALGAQPYFGKSPPDKPNPDSDPIWRLSSGWPVDPYSSDWNYGGPVMDRGRMQTMFVPATEGRDDLQEFWYAQCHSATTSGYGPTLLIAAMRAYVASKFGDEVELP